MEGMFQQMHLVVTVFVLAVVILIGRVLWRLGTKR